MKMFRGIFTGLALVCSVSAFAQTNQGTSPLTGAKGGTNNAFMQFAGPAASLKTYTLPNVNSTLAALATIQTWTAAQSFTDGTLILLGSSSGSSTVKAPATGGGTVTLFGGSDTIAGIATVQVLTNKTIAGASNTLSVRIANDVTGLGTGVATALGTAVGATGAPVVFNGGAGTPTQLTLTNAIGLPVAGITGLGVGVSTALGTAVGVTGGPVVFNGSIGTPSAGVLTNATGLPVSTGISGLGTGVATSLAINTNTAGGFPTYSAAAWTPVITTTGTVGTPAYSAQVGSYEIIGREVNVRFSVVLSGWTGSPTGTVNISGLPFASNATVNDNGICHFGSTSLAGLTAGNVLSGYILQSTSSITLNQISATTSGTVTAAQVGTTPTLVGWCQYHT